MSSDYSATLSLRLLRITGSIVEIAKKHSQRQTTSSRHSFFFSCKFKMSRQQF